MALCLEIMKYRDFSPRCKVKRRKRRLPLDCLQHVLSVYMSTVHTKQNKQLPYEKRRGRVIRALGCGAEGLRFESRSGEKTGKLSLFT